MKSHWQSTKLSESVDSQLNVQLRLSQTRSLRLAPLHRITSQDMKLLEFTGGSSCTTPGFDVEGV
jgi:hypothetical protein